LISRTCGSSRLSAPARRARGNAKLFDKSGVRVIVVKILE
jgi:hypothetical protein